MGFEEPALRTAPGTSPRPAVSHLDYVAGKLAERMGFEEHALRLAPGTKSQARLLLVAYVSGIWRRGWDLNSTPCAQRRERVPGPPLARGLRLRNLAERVGFEPTSPVLPGYPLSRRALSTAQTPLRRGILAKPHAFSNPRDPLSAHGKKCLHCPCAFVCQHSA